MTEIIEHINKFNKKNSHLNLEKIPDSKDNSYFLKAFSFARNKYEISCLPWAIKSISADKLQSCRSNSLRTYEMFEKYIFGLYNNKALLIFSVRGGDRDFYEINTNDQFVDTVTSIIQQLHVEYVFDDIYDELKEPTRPSIELKDAAPDIVKHVTGLWAKYEKDKAIFELHNNFSNNLELLFKYQLDSDATFKFIHDFNRIYSDFNISLRGLKFV
jgi:hypothetical protein